MREVALGRVNTAPGQVRHRLGSNPGVTRTRGRSIVQEEEADVVTCIVMAPQRAQWLVFLPWSYSLGYK